MSVVDLIAGACLLAGGALGIIGGIGVLRMPDFFTRLHAAGITDTLCAALILLGLVLHSGWGFGALKLLLVFAFLFFTSPTATHALAKAALHGGLRPMLAPSADEEAGPSNS